MSSSFAFLRHKRWLYVFMGFCALVGLLCTLPYHIPVSPSASLSYVFGYSNRTAMALVALAILTLFLAAPSMPKALPQQERQLSSGVVILALSITAALCLSLYLLTRRLDGFGESVYLVDRVWHAAQGQRPYIDFEYAYGALFLYGPALLVRFAGLPLGDAYGLFWIVTSLTGVLLLAQVIRWSTQGRLSHPNSLFLLLWAANLPILLSTGVNGSLLRFVAPCFLALLTFRALQPHANASAARPFHGRKAYLTAALSTLFLLILSPELAIAFSIGSIALFAWHAYLLQQQQDSSAFVRGMLYGLLLALTDLCLLALANHLHVFDTLKTFSQGGMNIPFTFGIFSSLFLIMIALVTCYTANGLRSGSLDAWMAIAAVSFLAIPGAMGRFDPPHMWNNPYGILLVALLVTSGFPSAWRLAVPIMFLLIVALPGITACRNQLSIFGKSVILFGLAHETPHAEMSHFDLWALKQISKSAGAEQGPMKLASYKAYIHATSLAPEKTFGLPPGQTFIAPYTYAPSRFGSTHAPELLDGYFFGTVNLVTPEQVQHKIQELEDHPDAFLIVMPEQLGSCDFSTEAARQAVQGIEFLPYHAPIRHPASPEQQLCRYLHQNYKPYIAATPEHYGYALWKRFR